MKENVKRAMEALKENGFKVNYFNTKEEALKALYEEIPAEATVGIGGSATVGQLGIRDSLMARGNTVFFHGAAATPEERKALLKQAMVADIYLASSNAVTEDGKLINTDGTGNRISSMLFGHDRVILICGENKIVKDEAEGRKRISEVVAPKNAERLNLTVKQISRATLIMDQAVGGTEVSVYLIGENLGF